jgi:hypothetical protein
LIRLCDVKILYRVVPIVPCSNLVLCPVQTYVQYCRAANIDLSRYLFDKRIRALRLVFSFLCPPTPYDVHKKNLGIYDGELPHSFWSGTATMLQRLGAPQEDITRHVGWQSTQMVGLYAPKDKVLGISSSPPIPAALICTLRY